MSLHFGIIYDPPSATACALDPMCPQRGYHMDAVNIACQAWNLNCTFSWYNSSDFGITNEEGIGTGLIGAIQNGQFDASLPVVANTQNRLKVVDFSRFYDIADIILFTRAPPLVKQGLDWSVIRTFEWPVWLSLLAILFLMTAWIGLACKIFKLRPLESNENISLLFFVLSPELGSIQRKPWSVHLLTCVWLFGGIVIASAYSGVLFSIKLFNKHDLPFTDLETFVQCLEKRQCRIITNSVEVSSIQALLGDRTPFGSRINKTLASNPIKLVSSIDQIPQDILHEKKQYLVGTGSKESWTVRLNGNKNCTFYMVDLPIEERRAFAVQKKSKFLPVLNRIVMVYHEHGLRKAMALKYRSQVSCEEPWAKPQTERSTDTLFSMATIFMLYGLGLLVATVVFAAERYRGSRH